MSNALDSNRNVFVSYFDVSKAFDTVWTDGLFYKLYHMSVKGRLWRLLFSAYVNIKCKVRVEQEMSDWYDMQRRIHQGGYLSLTKYTAFINELLVQLEDSGLCCSVEGVQSSPGGYADDLATTTVSKVKIDIVLKIVADYGNK